ncbi:MAG TPA: hypothetical protein GXX55_08365 [Firmicutes bacterium]|nr:hypothetical protein [Bacillota bacterium]
MEGSLPEDVGQATPGLDHDPRPDLLEDHLLWETLLVEAWASARAAPAPGDAAQLAGLLHGLRCLGARLERRPAKSGAHLRLDYRSACGPLKDEETGELLWQPDPEELRTRWLEPRRAGITNLFRRVEALLPPLSPP